MDCTKLTTTWKLNSSWSGFIGAVYTSAWAGLVLALAQAGCGLVHFHMQSGPDLNQKFDIIVIPNMSPVCWHPDQSSVSQRADGLQQNASCTQSSYEAEWSTVRFCPGTARCKRTIPLSAWKFWLMWMTPLCPRSELTQVPPAPGSLCS